MERTAAITTLSALAQPPRLAVVALLAGASQDGLTAGELAERTGTPTNTMSSHLLILTRAGLATSRRAGRNIFYAAQPETLRELSSLLADMADARYDDA